MIRVSIATGITAQTLHSIKGVWCEMWNR